jgi:hypothetical protein
MMIGIGTPSSHSRRARPIVALLELIAEPGASGFAGAPIALIGAMSEHRHVRRVPPPAQPGRFRPPVGPTGASRRQAKARSRCVVSSARRSISSAALPYFASAAD